MPKIARVLITLFAGLLAIVFSLSLLTAMTASAHSTPTDPHVTANRLPPAAPLKAAGGADTFGYTYQDETEAFGPTSVFTDISGSGTSLSLADDGQTDITLSFNFGFYGNTSNQLRVSNNGVLVFGSTSFVPKNNSCPITSAFFGNIIAPWWTDWGTGQVHWEEFGSAPNRYVVVQWTDMLPVGPVTSDGVTFQAILYETSNLILFNYQDANGPTFIDNGAFATIGIRDSGSDSLEYGSCFSSAERLIDNRTIRFSRNSITVVKDTLPASDPQSFDFTTSSISTTANFTLTDSLSETFYFVPGVYTVAETLPTDWDLTDLSCIGGANINTNDVTATITLGASEEVVCTYENTKRGSITVVKDAMPNSTQAFTFSSTLSPSFTLVDNGTPDSVTFSSLTPGSYTVTEEAVADWNLASLSCDDGDGGTITNLGTRSATIDLDPGQDITCTFNNSQFGRLIVEKVTDPSLNPTSFSFTASPGLSPGTFNLTDGNGQSFSDIVSGTYAITETVPTGWTMASSCDDGSLVSNISIGAGEIVTCVFTNTANPGTVTVEKYTIPTGRPEAFTFTTDITTADFTLSDGDNQLLNNVTIGTYSISETVPSGWTLTSSCSDGSPINAVDVGPGENITCVFTNTSDFGSVTVQKVTEPTGSLENFTFTTNLTTSNFSLSDGNSQIFDTIVPSSGYTVTEITPSGWDVVSTCSDGSPITNIDVASNENITCIFTNTQRGNIIIDKVTLPASDTTAFNFSLSGGPDTISQTFALTDTTMPYDSGSLKPGSYSLTETLVAGWSTVASCDNGDDPTTGNVTLDAGETVICTFTNTQQGNIIIDKVTLPASDTTDFDFSLTGGPDTINRTFALSDTTTPYDSGSLTPGSYSLTETPVTGWTTVAFCDNGNDPTTGNVTLNAGATVTCTFTNTKNSTLIVTKVTDPSPDSTSTSFSFTASGGLSPSTFNLTDGVSRTFTNLVSGTYTLSETVPSGWSLSSTSCDNGDPIDNISIGFAETVACVFTNTAAPGSVTVQKVTEPSSSSEIFTFTTNLTTSNFTLTNGVSQTFSSVTSGSGYTVTESTPAGWDVVSTCSDGSPVTNIAVSPGENITCIFTNTQQGNIIIDKVTLPASDTTDFDFSLTGGPDAISQTFALSDTTTPRDIGSLKPGSYSLIETSITGWITTASCDNGDDPTSVNVTLNAGETVTCTFTNTKSSTLVVTKVTDPSPDPTLTSFNFTASGGLSPASFNLTNGDIQTFTNVVSGTYTLSETVPSGWSLSTSCDNGDPISNIAVGLGETVSCVFTNTAAPGSITIMKDTVPDDPQDFVFTSTSSIGSFTLDDDGDTDATYSNVVTFPNLAIGSYIIEELATADWTSSNITCNDPTSNTTTDPAQGQANIALNAGENVTCTFTNTERLSSYVYLPHILKNYAPPQCTDIDLQIASLSITGGIVTVVVENSGACPTDSGFWVDLYADPQTQPASLVGVTSDRRWNSSSINATHGMGWEVPTLAAGSSITLTSDGSVGPVPTDTNWPPATGATIYAYADSFDTDDPDNDTFVEIPETDENNNQSTVATTATGFSQEATTSSNQFDRPDLD